VCASSVTSLRISRYDLFGLETNVLVSRDEVFDLDSSIQQGDARHSGAQPCKRQGLTGVRYIGYVGAPTYEVTMYDGAR